MPYKVGEIIKLMEADGWVIARTRRSHRQYRHPTKPGKVTVAGKPSDTLRSRVALDERRRMVPRLHPRSRVTSPVAPGSLTRPTPYGAGGATGRPWSTG